jgi:drug/metabolite transporter (DMT)-like permease
MCPWLLLQGIVASGFAFPLMSWCLRVRGPLYVAMFGPLIIVFVAVLSSVFLDETLHLGMYVAPLARTHNGHADRFFLVVSFFTGDVAAISAARWAPS